MNDNHIDYIIKNGQYLIFKINGRCYIFLSQFSRLLAIDENKCLKQSGGRYIPTGDFASVLNKLAAGCVSPEAVLPSNKTLLSAYYAGYKPSVSALNLDLTARCNLSCLYCYAKGGDYSTQSGSMDFETVRGALSDALEAGVLETGKKFRFEFFGGEPLFNTGVIKEVLELEKSSFLSLPAHSTQSGGIINRISTNLTLYNETISGLLAQGNFIISVSIDGAAATQNAQRPYKNGSGSYGDIIKNLTAIKKAAPELITVARMTVYGNPGGFLEELEELAALNIFDYCSIYCAAIEEGAAPGIKINEDFKKTYKSMAARYASLISQKDNIFKGCLELNRYIRYLIDGSFAANHCRAGIGYFTLDAGGAVYPCHRLIGKDEFKISGGLKNIAAAPEEWRVSVDERPVCKDCAIRYLCGGGCKQEALISGGGLLAGNPKICDFAGLLFDSAAIALDSLNESQKAPITSDDQLSDLFVLCGRHTVKSSEGRDKALLDLFKGYIADSRLLLLALFFALFILAAAAAPPAAACPGTNEPWHEMTLESKSVTYLESGYFTSYGEAEGLYAKSIQCLAYAAKTKLLFIGSKEDGVIIFDGKKFSPLITNQPLPSPNILSICYSNSDDRLIIGTNAGAAIVSSPAAGTSSKADILTLKNSDIQSDIIYSLAAEGGTVYAGTDRGFFTIAASSVRKIVRKTSSGIDLGKINSIFVNESGVIYLATDLMILKTVDCEKFDPDDFSGQNNINGATKIAGINYQPAGGAETREVKIDSGIAFSTSTGFFVSNGAGNLTSFGVNEGLNENWVSCFARDNLSQQLNKAQITVDKKLDASSKNADSGQNETPDSGALAKILAKFESADTRIAVQDGNLTLKTRELIKLLNNPEFAAINEKYSFFTPAGVIPAPSNPAFESLKSGLWIGTNNSGLAVYNGSEFINFNKDNSPLTSNRIRDILCGGDFVYIATDGGGLLKYGQFDLPAPGADIEKILSGNHNFIKAIGSDIYIGGPKGLYHYNLINSTSEVMPERPELKNIQSICADDKGSLYLASKNAGAVRLEGRYKDAKTNKYRFRSVTGISKKDGTPSYSCTGVHFIENKGVIAGFSEISSKISEKCAIIAADGQITRFAPLSDTAPENYDTTQPSLAAPNAFLNIDDAVIAGLGEGGSNALVFFSGSSWQYMTTPLSCVFSRVNSISRGRGGEVYIAGDTGVALFSGGQWKRIDISGGVPVNDSVCAMRDTLSDGVWILRKYGLNEKTPGKCVLTYGARNSSYSKVLDGSGVSFTQLDPYIFVLTTKGVYKIKK
jgi:radical SAM protein with 4Fe4S-binding SPASM domain